MGAGEGVMDDDPKRTSAPAIRDGTEPAKRSQPDGRDLAEPFGPSI